MRRAALACLSALLLSTAQAAPDVFVAYPDPNYRVAHERVILEGSVTPGATLTIDGVGVPVGPDGLFMQWWPLKVGTNDLRLVARQGGQSGSLTLRVIRTVPKVYPAVPTVIDRASAAPKEHWEFWDAAVDAPAERSVPLSFMGSPGGRAAYRVGSGPAIAMKEGPAGTYSATYVMPNHTRLQQAAFSFSLTGKDGKTVSAMAPGRLTSTQGGPRLGTQKEGSVQGLGLNEATVLVTDLKGEPLLYPRSGMTFTLVGKQGEDLRARLAPGLSALISAKQLNLTAGRGRVATGGPIRLSARAELPVAAPVPRTPALTAAPTASSAAQSSTPLPGQPEELLPTTQAPSGLEVIPLPAESPPAQPLPSAVPTGDLQVYLPLGGARLPFTAVQDSGGQRLSITLYGSFTSPLTGLAGSDPLLGEVTVRQVALGVTRVTLKLTAPQAWGFHVNYAGDDLLVTLRRPPSLNPARPLEGRTITLDPGHGGTQKGGAGSLRIPEKNLVLPIALRAAELLRAQGAKVVLTRTSDVTLDLYDRGLAAENSQSDLLVSIHANALPDGRDPRGIRGPEVYYTHPQAQAVAGAILNQLRAQLPELGPGDGLKPDAFLALTRPTTQISLLVELAYLTDAGNLRTLHSPSGKERMAQAVAAGILDFYAAQAGRASR